MTNCMKATAPEPTTEERLKAIIEKHEEGGYMRWSILKERKIDRDGRIFIEPHSDESYSVLEILQDTKGLKACYGEEESSGLVPHYNWVSHEILDAYHSGEGNNYKEAVKCAYELL